MMIPYICRRKTLDCFHFASVTTVVEILMENKGG